MLLLSVFALLLSASLAAVLSKLAPRLGLLDRPDSVRKLHERPIPLVGGIALFVVSCGLVTALLFVPGALTSGSISAQQYIGWMLGGAVLMIGGVLDDRYNLRARNAIIAPVFASLLAVVCGIGFVKLTNPFGGFIMIPAIVGSVVTFAWLMGSMYTVKLLDGADGLAGTVSALAVAMIGALALTEKYYQPDVAMWCAVVLGALLGFLLFNLPPAKAYLGEGGGTFLGFTLGVLAVAGGSKIATFALVMGLPILDVALVLLRRLRDGKQMFAGDRSHLHHLLIARGVTGWRLLARYAVVSMLFGFSALILPSFWKLVMLLVLSVFSVVWILTLESQTTRAASSR